MRSFYVLLDSSDTGVPEGFFFFFFDNVNTTSIQITEIPAEIYKSKLLFKKNQQHWLRL